MQTSFGSGRLFLTPLSDAFGNSIAVPTPLQIGILQNTSIDFGRDIKELHGQGSYAVDIGGGKGKLSGKAAAAKISARQFNELYFGQSVIAGKDSIYIDTVGEAIPATPFQLTTTPPETGTFRADLGVNDEQGEPMTRVSGTPTTGQYSLSGSTYTFAAADVGKLVYRNYRYSVSASGKSIVVRNLDMGELPIFQAELLLKKAGKIFYIRLPNFASSKFGLEPKQDDFLIPSFEFMGFADGLGNIAYISTQE